MVNLFLVLGSPLFYFGSKFNRAESSIDDAENIMKNEALRKHENTVTYFTLKHPPKENQVSFGNKFIYNSHLMFYSVPNR